MAVTVDADAVRLVVAEAVGDPDVRLTELIALTGGASRRTFRFIARGSDGSRRSLVLQVATPAALENQERPAGVEAAALRLAATGAVPVPRLLASSPDVDPLGGAFLLFEHVAGETIARRILRDDRYETARGRLTAQCAAALASIHRLDPAAVPELPDQDPLDRSRAVLDEVGIAVPTFELAFRWLDRNCPPLRPSTVVHGDFRLGNLIVDETGLAAVLDWELCHRGQAAFDLGWMCVRAWRFGSSSPVAGVGERSELLRAYRAEGGADISTDELIWWEVAGTLIWGVICASQAYRHLSGRVRSHELAAIGRRIVENEWDLLELIR